ncbi:C40 family peptidase [Chitinophagaceae bacterium LB-8]|uniref:C40 family peptidase n=1 Tax=Paraflavisolibacter caeni TaxID=2982496 RepID=A0A9X2XT29_9BACT|nr:C40 family peptidase [Paraflavisolibacter caeni]MCU7548456.1 C40 family peptidase [Paraflavisolibacter caeni]
MNRYPFFLMAVILYMSCDFTSLNQKETPKDTVSSTLDDSVAIDSAKIKDSAVEVNTRMLDTAVLPPSIAIDTKNVHPEELVEFAETLIGTPYHYASTDPKIGFDCSGFITYVFNHFGIAVPRSSIDFTNVGRVIPVDSVKRGDLILFTGTDSTEELVGHMGIIVSGKDSVQFIHATSGKAYGVTITPLNKYYLSRFVKTIRVFPERQ